MKEEITVAVIGAGAAGLNALKVLNHNPKDAQSTFRATAFEQTDHIGGTWVYTDCVGTDEMGLPVHSSMYKNLSTNLAKETMAFPDFPFPSHLSSFPSHQDVFQYLKDYAAHFQLCQYIKFRTIVEHVRPIQDDGKKFGLKWEVTTADVTNLNVKQTQIFDAVLVCNGHFAKPLIPDIPGLNTFGGHLIHSHDYRKPGAYYGKDVLVLGANMSGQDVACDISDVAKKIYLSHNYPSLPTVFPDNVEQTPGLKGCHRRTVELQDSRVLKVDAIILCTGYRYDFPFLDDSVGITVKEGRITHLYKHFLSVDCPSLAIVGIMNAILPFPTSHFQISYFRSILDGSQTLPSREKMLKEEDEDFKALIREGRSARHAHRLDGIQFEYTRTLADLAGVDRLPLVIEKIYKINRVFRKRNFTTFKKVKYIISDDFTDVKVVFNREEV